MPAPLDRRLVQRATATRFFLAAVALTGIVNAALVIAQAWVLSWAISGVFATHSTTFPGPLPRLGHYLLVVAVIFLARAGLTWLTAWGAHRASASVKSLLRADVLRARLTNPVDATSSGSMIHLVTTGLDAIDGYFEKYLPQLVMATFIPVMVIVVVLTNDVQSALIITATLPLIPLFMVLIGLTTQDAVARRFAMQNRLANHFADLIAGLPTLQVFGRARAQLANLKATEARSRSVTMATLRVAFLSGGVLEFLATCSVALVAVTIGFRVVDGGMDLQTALFILLMAPEAYLPVRLVGVHFHDSASGTAAAKAAFELIEAASTRPGGGTVAPDLGTSAIVFDQVRVRFAEGEMDGLPKLSFTVKPGSTVALVGPSGAGKSTALAVLMGFCPPTSGRVLVDGIDLAEIDLASWRAQIAWVAQDPGMIRGCIADNLALGDPEATPRRQRAALDRAGGASLDLARPVGDDGEGLSAGERRRVALARALLRIESGSARLLVLDEPTAGLDQATEQVAIAAVRASGVGAIFITHRQAMLELADQIIPITPAVVPAEEAQSVDANHPGPLVPRSPLEAPGGGAV